MWSPSRSSDQWVTPNVNIVYTQIVKESIWCEIHHIFDTKERLDVLIFEYGNRQKKAAFCYNSAGGWGSAEVRF